MEGEAVEWRDEYPREGMERVRSEQREVLWAEE
jgi:hypothetical protein